jgi:hypothetical protein
MDSSGGGQVRRSQKSACASVSSLLTILSL